MLLFDRILASRGITDAERQEFFLPEYLNSKYDPFLLPDMAKAVDRLLLAHKKQQKITIYGDYDIDGLTATTVLYQALKSFGFQNLATYIPSRFDEGYGLTIPAIENIRDDKTELIVTVDCGSRSRAEIDRANELGIDVIVTDHHEVLPEQPNAIAVVNPRRKDHDYPFCELAGVGVAFKLVQALQARLNSLSDSSIYSGLPFGQEKWLLDLVALGTVCDIVPLIQENRSYVYWGLKVLEKTSHLGLRALMEVAGVDPKKLNTRSIGFAMGPRMNASGRLETAQHSLKLLMSESLQDGYSYAHYLDELNSRRRFDQDKIFKEASLQAEKMENDFVIVVSDKNWNHGIVGIVASKLVEKYHKPAIVIHEIDDIAKGSARSFGDFKMSEAIDSCRELIISGGGHAMAAGVTLNSKTIPKFRKAINDFYKNLNLSNQEELLLPTVDATAFLSEINKQLVEQINQLEPFGNGNLKPVLQTDELVVKDVRIMGANNQHIKLLLRDNQGCQMNFLAFNAPESYFVKIGDMVSVRYEVELNEWNGTSSVEGRLLFLKKTN